MRLVAVTLASAILLGGAAVLSAQEAPAVTEVRDVRWVWKAEVDLPGAASVVILDWHSDFGVTRRYPKDGLAAERLEAGRHTLAGEQRHAETRGHARFATLQMRWHRLIPFMDRPVWPESYTSPTLESMRMVRFVRAEPYRAPTPWRAFVLTLPSDVSAAVVDSLLRDHEFLGDARADIAALAAALGAASWGGEVRGARRQGF